MRQKCKYGKVKGTDRCKTKTQFVNAMQRGRRKAKRTNKYVPSLPSLPRMPGFPDPDEY